MSGLLKLKIMTNAELQNQKDQAFVEAQGLVNKLASFVKISEALLFGSAITGKMTSDSDLDILVVLNSNQDIKAAQKIVYSGGFSRVAVDWIFKNKSDFETRKNIGGVCFVAFQDGVRLI